MLDITVLIFSFICTALYQPLNHGELANPFATPLEILPEWYFLRTFNMLRILSSKLIGVLSMIYLPAAVVVIPFGENMNRYQNPFRRPPMISIFVTLSTIAIWLGVGGLGSIFNAIPLVHSNHKASIFNVPFANGSSTLILSSCNHWGL